MGGPEREVVRSRERERQHPGDQTQQAASTSFSKESLERSGEGLKASPESSVAGRTRSASEEDPSWSLRVDYAPSGEPFDAVCWGPVPIPGDARALVGFQPEVDMSRVHHLVLYGVGRKGLPPREASQPRSHPNGRQWRQRLPSFLEPAPCGELPGTQNLYSWARTGQASGEAVGLRLPNGQGFPIDQDHGLAFLYLELHYAPEGGAPPLPPGKGTGGATPRPAVAGRDRSGLRLT